MNSISSEKIDGDTRCDACHAKSEARQRYATPSSQRAAPAESRSSSCSMSCVTRRARGRGTAAVRSRGRRSGSRRRRSCRTRRAAPAALAAAPGIVTSTSSTCSSPSSRSTSSRLPWTVTPWIRRRRSAGLSSTKPTTRVSGVSASSRASARPERPAPATRTRFCGPRALPRPGSRRSARREPATSVMQSSASTMKISSGKSMSGRVARTIPIVSGAEITTAATIASRSRADAKRQIRR